MLPLHDPKASRHARMFELLRQRELAKITAKRLKDQARLEGLSDAEKDVKKAALDSLAAPAPSARGQFRAPPLSDFRR